jgi:hypothetical protein
VEQSSLVRLEQDLKDAGLPVLGVADVNREEPGWWVVKRPDGVWVRVDWVTPPTPAQEQQATTIILDFVIGTLVPRKLDAIVSDLDALNTTQKANLGDWITETIPLPGGRQGQRWRTSDKADVWVAFRVAPFLTGAAPMQVRLTGVAAMCRDEQPEMLVHPSWDPSINVPGWELAPEPPP